MLFPPNVCMFAAHLPTWGCRRDHAHHLEDARAIAAATGCAALVCLPLVDGAATAGSADAPPCLGALTLGFASEADVNGAALKAALLLARALVTEQRQALLDVAGLVSQMLLPAPAPASGPAAAGGSGGEEDCSEGSDLDVGNGWASSGGEERERRGRGRRRGGTAPPRAAAAEPAPPPLPQSMLLTYRDPGLEHRFARYHAAHMKGVDRAAYFLCFLFFW